MAISARSTTTGALVENHLSSRIRLGFDLAEIIEEFAILGRVTSGIWEEKGDGKQPDVREVRSALHMHQPEMLDQRRELSSKPGSIRSSSTEWASKIDVNIDRAEKMIRDLLDANRIRAKQPIPLPH